MFHGYLIGKYILLYCLSHMYLYHYKGLYVTNYVHVHTTLYGDTSDFGLRNVLALRVFIMVFFVQNLLF